MRENIASLTAQQSASFLSTIKIHHYLKDKRQNMASSKEYLNYIMDQLSSLKDVTYRAMMGEYIVYYHGKIVGGIYDDRFLLKPTRSVKRAMPNAMLEIPYKGAKAMILADNVDDSAFITGLLNEMIDELPTPKKKN